MPKNITTATTEKTQETTITNTIATNTKISERHTDVTTEATNRTIIVDQESEIQREQLRPSAGELWNTTARAI